MNRLYQWFHARATSLVAEKTEGRVTRITRTEITVEQQQSLWQVRDAAKTGATVCPVCGHGLAGATTITNLCSHGGAHTLHSEPAADPGLKDHQSRNR